MVHFLDNSISGLNKHDTSLTMDILIAPIRNIDLIITKIKCSNFRSFENETIFEFRQGLNIIIGENNSGKTNFVRLLEVVLTRLRHHTSIQSKILTYDQSNQLNVIPKSDPEPLSKEEYYNKNTTKPIEFGLILDLQNDSDFLKNLKIKLTESPTVRRDGEKYSSVERINENSNKLGMFYNIRAFDQKNESHIMTSSLMYDNPEKKEGEKMTAPLRINLSELLSIEFDYEVFSKFLTENFVIFPEFRTRPGQNIINNTTSPSGLELTSALDNLKNGSWENQQKFRQIEETFQELFHLNFSVSRVNGLMLSFINTSNGLEISSNGVGGGVIQMLTILTHLIGEKNKVFIIDEPELNLHPHKKRILLKVLKQASMDNQIIFTTHSSEFIDMEEVEKITLLRLIDGRTIVTKFVPEKKNNRFMQTVLLRLKKTEQKEFFFAKKVLLVEGPTEFGALPKFAENLGFDFDIYGVSIIPMETNYFVGMIRILQEFDIPFIVLSDLDVMMNIKKTVKCGCKEFRTSSIFYQLDLLNLLKNEDKLKLQSLENNIFRIIPPKVSTSTTVRFLTSLLEQDVSKDLKLKIERLLSQYELETYDDYAKGKIMELFNSITTTLSINIKILKSDFEGLFEKDHQDILKESRRLYGESKVLQGYYLAKCLPVDKIPCEISDLINDIKSLSPKPIHH